MPGGPNVGANMRELSGPGAKKRPYKQRVAIALSEARRAGANIPPPKSKVSALADAYRGGRRG